jgi:hypothetical protein
MTTGGCPSRINTAGPRLLQLYSQFLRREGNRLSRPGVVMTSTPASEHPTVDPQHAIRWFWLIARVRLGQ